MFVLLDLEYSIVRRGAAKRPHTETECRHVAVQRGERPG